MLLIVLTPRLIGAQRAQSIGAGLLGEPRNLAQPITIVVAPALASTGVDTGLLLPLRMLTQVSGVIRRGSLHRRTTGLAHK